jgi:very-short-patch-repair endonuclease
MAQHMSDTLVHNARQMRSRPTDAEKKLWRRLSHRQLAGCKFRRQVPIGPYIVDFACLPKKLIVEVDGSQHIESENDLVRTAWLESQGYRVVRCWNNEVLTNIAGVVEAIYAAVIAPSNGSTR